MRSSLLTWFLLLFLLAPATQAESLVVLTRGKSALFRAAQGRGTVRVGADRAFATLIDPRCPGASSVQLAAYPQATNEVESQPLVALDCARWRATPGGYLYRNDASAPAGGVRRVFYRRDGLMVDFRGAGFVPPSSPVGYIELWFTVNGARHLVRFHDLLRNETGLVIARRPSTAAADGEQAFWDVLHGDDRSPAREAAALDALGRAVRRDRGDGRSPFLLGMMHLYRFGQQVARPGEVSDAARADLIAANDAFGVASPRLWDGVSGDSRVPGFVAAAKYQLGQAIGDGSLEAEALADLDAAVAINPTFNLFDFIPVAQATPATDPLFARVFGIVDGLLTGSAAACVTTQPELCANAGLAPNNLSGSLLLFGDLYAKAGQLAQAQTWYGIASAITLPSYRFLPVVTDRQANAAERVASYLDADPSNDPPLIGAGEESCTTCHNR